MFNLEDMGETRVFYLNDVLTFGKHSGKTIHQIWSSDPGYIKWATGNNVFKVEGSFRPEVQKEVVNENKEEVVLTESPYNIVYRECPF